MEVDWGAVAPFWKRGNHAQAGGSETGTFIQTRPVGQDAHLEDGRRLAIVTSPAHPTLHGLRNDRAPVYAGPSLIALCARLMCVNPSGQWRTAVLATLDLEVILGNFA